MRKKFKISFANLSIRFGEKELLDYIHVVSSALLIDTHIRRTKSGSYFFLDTEVFRTDENDPLTTVIAGRIVKNTTLSREQKIEGKTLVEDVATLETTPSAFFALFVSDHRLAFVPETRFPPTLKNFEAAVSLFVKREFKKFEDKTYYDNKALNSKYTRSSFYEEHSPPSINLVPLASRQGIEQFMSRFSSINRITVHLVERNQDSDGKSIFEQLLDQTTPLGPTSAKYEVRAGGEGLDIDETKEFVSDTTDGGYEKVSLQGKDEDGANLNGSNDLFKLTAEKELSPEPLNRVMQLSKLYDEQKKNGNIKVSTRDRVKVEPALRTLWENDNQ